MQWKTRTGRVVDFLNFQVSCVDIEDIAHALSQLCRFNGHTSHFYSVAQHSVRVASCVPRRFALEALLHDASEAYLGDVITPLKILLPDYRRIEDTVQGAIHKRYGIVPTQESMAFVHGADRLVLETERGELGFDTDHEGIGAMWTPHIAKAVFLNKFVEAWSYVHSADKTSPSNRDPSSN